MKNHHNKLNKSKTARLLRLTSQNRTSKTIGIPLVTGLTSAVRRECVSERIGIGPTRLHTTGRAKRPIWPHEGN